jgi:hypothetical protein
VDYNIRMELLTKQTGWQTDIPLVIRPIDWQRNCSSIYWIWWFALPLYATCCNVSPPPPTPIRSTSCSVIYNISPRRCQLTSLANLFRQENELVRLFCTW